MVRGVARAARWNGLDIIRGVTWAPRRYGLSVSGGVSWATRWQEVCVTLLVKCGMCYAIALTIDRLEVFSTTHASVREDKIRWHDEILTRSSLRAKLLETSLPDMLRAQVDPALDEIICSLLANGRDVGHHLIIGKQSQRMKLLRSSAYS